MTIPWWMEWWPFLERGKKWVWIGGTALLAWVFILALFFVHSQPRESQMPEKKWIASSPPVDSRSWKAFCHLKATDPFDRGLASFSEDMKVVKFPDTEEVYLIFESSQSSLAVQPGHTVSFHSTWMALQRRFVSSFTEMKTPLSIFIMDIDERGVEAKIEAIISLPSGEKIRAEKVVSLPILLEPLLVEHIEFPEVQRGLRALSRWVYHGIDEWAKDAEHGSVRCAKMQSASVGKGRVFQWDGEQWVPGGKPSGGLVLTIDQVTEERLVGILTAQKGVVRQTIEMVKTSERSPVSPQLPRRVFQRNSAAWICEFDKRKFLLSPEKGFRYQKGYFIKGTLPEGFFDDFPGEYVVIFNEDPEDDAYWKADIYTRDRKMVGQERIHLDKNTTSPSRKRSKPVLRK